MERFPVIIHMWIHDTNIHTGLEIQTLSDYFTIKETHFTR